MLFCYSVFKTRYSVILSLKHVIMSFRRCKGTAVFSLPQSPFRGISHTKQMVIAVYNVTFTPKMKLRDEGYAPLSVPLATSGS